MTQGPKTRIGAWLARPLASFHLVVTIAVMLTVLGLVMVLSASGVEQYTSGGSAYSLFIQQLIFAVLGSVLFYVALRIPARTLRRFSFPVFVIVLIMLVLVLIPGIGTAAQGARRWFTVGGFSLQPSELMKVVLAIWGAHLLASRRPDDNSVRTILIPLVPAALLVFALVVAQPNLSTTIALGIILGALLWFGGLPLKLFGTIAVTGVVLAGTLALTAGYRSDRVKSFFNPSDDLQGGNYQAKQALYSLADGRIFGVGLGQSAAKWNYLPNAHNDFIFAIIGEELGYVGCLVVLGLFAGFVYTGLRIAARSIDPFWRLLSATATTWIVGQAMINIGYVIGLLPVTGLQLPLVSAGGSSLAITLFMFGIIANAARHEPEAVAALQSGQDGKISRLLRLPMPVPYRASGAVRRVAPQRRNEQVRQAGQNRQRRQAPTRNTQDPQDIRERGIRR
ncbi:putative lipid II flippase FtsW [Rhodococcus sp. SRB_17]|uniref:putative lipid II flippase FtsW n=1 Tax=Rhodococcus sp. OK302 TaxID=1882769 RepID=UPI000B9442F6|nr:putative lipid II flippase FtsW [Rhodococcus sp. OK302]NMM83182.1 putative lipid II flippase FtsW [Rhodococcus sp. SRB_17]OYD70835.1 cell division-specific peptidoglycan biosynthesis regulator FtsW [Rhodococcus sp. OK302]